MLPLVPKWCLPIVKSPVLFTLYNHIKDWSVVDLQCCVSFCCIAKWFSYTYICNVCVCIYIHIHTHILLYSFPLWFIIGYWIEFPELYSKTLLFFHSICNSLHLLMWGTFCLQNLTPNSTLKKMPEASWGPLVTHLLSLKALLIKLPHLVEENTLYQNGAEELKCMWNLRNLKTNPGVTSELKCFHRLELIYKIIIPVLLISPVAFFFSCCRGMLHLPQKTWF